MLTKLLANGLFGVVLLASASACTAKAGEASPQPGAVVTSSTDPAPSVTGSGPRHSPYEISDTPFTGATADQVVQAWTARWHPEVTVLQTVVVHVRRATMDNPFGPGTLELDVSQKGKGNAPGAVQVGFTLKDPSTKKYLQLTPKVLDDLLRACCVPALSEAQIKPISSWIYDEHPNQEAGGIRDFPGLSVQFSTAPGLVRVYILSR